MRNCTTWRFDAKSRPPHAARPLTPPCNTLPPSRHTRANPRSVTVFARPSRLNSSVVVGERMYTAAVLYRRRAPTPALSSTIDRRDSPPARRRQDSKFHSTAQHSPSSLRAPPCRLATSRLSAAVGCSGTKRRGNWKQRYHCYLSAKIQEIKQAVKVI